MTRISGYCLPAVVIGIVTGCVGISTVLRAEAMSHSRDEATIISRTWRRGQKILFDETSPEIRIDTSALWQLSLFMRVTLRI